MQKVLPGQRLSIPSRTYNAFVEAAEAHQRQAHHQVGRTGALASSGTSVTVRNTTGADQDLFAVLELDQILIAPADNLREFQFRHGFTAKKPAAGAKKLAILLEPILSNSMGKALLAGVTPVRLDVKDVGHAHAVAVSNQTAHLETAGSGPVRILYKESGTGLKWGLIQFPFEASQERCFHITEGTILDESDPTGDYSGASIFTGRAFLPPSEGTEQKVVIKFPKAISAKGPFFIGCASRGYCRVEQWDPNAYNLNVWARTLALGRAITSFNGLTLSTLNWNNRNTLTLGPSLNGVQIAQALAHNAVGSGTLLASGYSDSSLNQLPIECGLRFNCGLGVTFEGVLLELLVQENNVYYGFGGYTRGDLEIVRGDSESAWNFFGFYNPQ